MLRNNPVLRQGIAVAYRLLRKPRRVRIHGVAVAVDPAWPPRLIEGLYRAHYENWEARVLEATLRPDDRYFEVGASIGVMMTAACAIVGDRNVTAVEADPALVEIAANTAAQNGFAPKIINAILGEDEQSRPFYVADDFWESSLAPTVGARQIVIPGRRFLTELDRADATYLMVDIEGAEIELLSCVLPASVRAVCLEMHPDLVGHRSVQELLQHLMAQGFVLDTQISGTQVIFVFRGQD